MKIQSKSLMTTNLRIFFLQLSIFIDCSVLYSIDTDQFLSTIRRVINFYTPFYTCYVPKVSTAVVLLVLILRHPSSENDAYIM